MKQNNLADAVDASVTVVSKVRDFGENKGFAIQVVFSSATLAGTLTLEGSLDGATFVEVAGSSQAIAAGESHLYNVANAFYTQVRVRWVRSAGTGTITIDMTEKENVVKGA